MYVKGEYGTCPGPRGDRVPGDRVGYGFTIVSQQTLYTIADIASKIIYGVMLNVSSTVLSREQREREAPSAPVEARPHSAV
jgi:hypothetical protein